MSVKNRIVKAKDAVVNYIEENKGLLALGALTGLVIVVRLHTNEIAKLEDRVQELEDHPSFFVKEDDKPGYRRVRMSLIE